MAEPNEGFINLHRKIREHPYWQDPERLRAWLDCLFMAAWKPHRRMIGTGQYELRRGEFIASEPFLAKRWKWSRGKVRRFMATAVEASELEQVGSTGDGTRYLVVRYEDYQSARPGDGTSVGQGSERNFSDSPEKSPKNGTGDGTGDGTGKAVAAVSSPPSDRPSNGTGGGTSIGHPSDIHQDRQPAIREEVGKKEEEQNKTDVEEGGPGPGVDLTGVAEAQQQHQAAMQKLVEKAAAEPPSGLSAARVRGELSMIVSGDDVTAWQDSSGNPAPWPERPRLLRLALRQWYLDREEYPKLRSALRYTIGQQLNPYELPEGGRPAMSSQDEQRHYQEHRNNGAHRPKAQPSRMSSDQVEQQNGGDEAQRWAAENPQRFEEIKTELAASERIDTENPLERIQLIGLALKRVREEELCESASGPGS